MRFAIFIFCACCFTASCAAGQPAPRANNTQPSIAAAAQNAPATRQDDIQALRKDVNRMRALVQQMETNLAFVDTTASPLKHQFQLEIDMWKAVIDQMERRLEAASSR